jgi:hypothetical protein
MDNHAMTTKRLTRRQARWAEFLADFNFEITYRPGKQNQKADALTRRPRDRPEGVEDDRQKEMSRTILTLDRLHPDIRCEVQLVEVLEISETSSPLIDYIKEAQEKDPFCQETIKLLNSEARTSAKVSLAHCDVKDGLLHYQQRIWVPESLYARVLRDVHQQPLVGHTGVAKTLAILKRQFYWPRMDKTVAQFIANCHECKRAKAFVDGYNGVLIPLPIPHQPWQDISMDFVTGLPQCQEFDAVLVVSCRMSKERHLIPCKASDKGTSAEATTKLIIREIVRLHGLPDTVISDRGPQFVAEFWKHLCMLLRIDARLSTAFHPETDGQTEAENKEMERYIRTYVSYLQDDWVEWLPLAEFAANNAPSETTKVSPFYATKGYNPRMSFDIRPAKNEARNPKEVEERKRALRLATHLKEVWEQLREQIGLAQTRMERFADRNRKPAPAYKPKDKVWLSSMNIKTQRPSKKLDHKNLGPFEVIEKIGATSYRLRLPESMKIHPVFHSNLLRLDPEDPLPGQTQEPPPPVVIDNEDEFEVEKVLDSRLHRKKKLQYRVAWVGYPPDSTWYEAENFENSPELVREFHALYPNKPGPRTITD